ncbi:MAG: dephospho-CoA kinase [Bdellovibrionaceae bacterium]|nr:dephospho-CoA kinase [Pseudobdellovibrionaceae bacterium]
MKWVGITGSIGTGKTTVSNLIRSLGYRVLDADLIAKEELQKNSLGYQQIVKQWGSGILGFHEEIDTKKMAQIVFSQPEQLRVLEAIIHPLVQKKVQQIKKESEFRGDLILFYDVPLLYEKKLQNQFDEVILVVASPSIQVARIKKRSQWTDEEIQHRLQAQMSLEEKAKYKNIVINNDEGLPELEIKVKEIIKKIIGQ